MATSRRPLCTAFVLAVVCLAMTPGLAGEDDGERGWLGVHVAIVGEAASPSGREALRILRVIPGGPAAKAGLEEGDVLLTVRKTEIHGLDVLWKVLADTRVGEQVACRVLRDGETLAFELKLGPRPQELATESPVHEPRDDDRRLDRLEAERAEVMQARKQTIARIAEIEEAIVAAAEGKEDHVRELIQALRETTHRATHLGERQEQLAGAIRETATSRVHEAAEAAATEQLAMRYLRRDEATRSHGERVAVEGRIEAIENQIRELSAALRRLLHEVEEIRHGNR